MTADRIPALLEPIQNRLNAATPGPWLINDREQTVSVEHPQGGIWLGEIMYDRSSEGYTDWTETYRRDAEFIAKAPTDQARLLAAVQAVTAIHKPVTYWMTHEDADVSYQSKEDVLAERRDLTEEDLVPFELCSHCRMIEDSPCEGECTMQAGYRESLWPCPTVAAVEAALGGEA